MATRRFIPNRLCWLAPLEFALLYDMTTHAEEAPTVSLHMDDLNARRGYSDCCCPFRRARR